MGEGTCSAAERMISSSKGLPGAPRNWPPLVDSSTLRYATQFFVRSAALSSPHSVEPTRPYSSLSQDANMLKGMLAGWTGNDSATFFLHLPIRLPSRCSESAKSSGDLVHGSRTRYGIHGTATPRIMVVAK